MASLEDTAEKLEQMGITAWEKLERSIAYGTNADVADSTARLVFVADGVSQLRSGADRSVEEMGTGWVNAAAGFVIRGVRANRISRDMAKSRILNPALREIQILEWLETRQEVFAQNPGYHGSRFGPEYAQAMSSGRITYDPSCDYPTLRDLGVL